MFFFSKRTTIHLDVFTNRKDVFDFYPVDHSEKFFPEWWKKMPKHVISLDGFSPMSTIKRCVGLNEYYRNGITIPLWSDLCVNIIEDNLVWQFSDRVTEASPHPSVQIDGYLDMNIHRHLKIASPWAFKCKEEISWIWTQPTWNFSNPTDIIIPPGRMDYKYNCSTNVNIFFNAESEKIVSIDAGQPLANIFPMTERKLKIHHHLVDTQEYSNILSIGATTKFLGKYMNNRRLMKSKEKRCPFHL
jgi:hypothetical protein